MEYSGREGKVVNIVCGELVEVVGFLWCFPVWDIFMELLREDQERSAALASHD